MCSWSICPTKYDESAPPAVAAFCMAPMVALSPNSEFMYVADEAENRNEPVGRKAGS